MGSRYVKELALNIPQADVENAIQAYLAGNSFKMVFEKGENYFKSGGVMLPLKGFKYSFQDGVLHIEAWVGKIGKELNIGDGKFIGSAAKLPYYNSLLSLMATLEKVSLANQQGSPAEHASAQINSQAQTQQDSYAQNSHSQQNLHTQPRSQPQTNIPNQAPVFTKQPGVQAPASSAVFNEVNNANNRNAKIAFWLSIAAIVLMFASKFSLLVNAASYTLAIKYGLKSQKSGLAVAAIVINSIVILITILIIFLS